jgi:hypothetical protein
MSAASVIAQLIADVYSRRSGLPAGKSPAPMDTHVASSLIDSGVFLQSGFTAAADLDALPVGSVVRTVKDGRPRIQRFHLKLAHGWFFMENWPGEVRPYTSAELLDRHSDGTATYVWDGDKR